MGEISDRFRGQWSRKVQTSSPQEELRIETNEFTIPLQQTGERCGLYTFSIELGGVSLALHPEVNVD